MERYMKASLEKFPEVKLLITWLVCLSVLSIYYQMVTSLIFLSFIFVLNVFLQVNTAVELNWIEQRRKGPRSMIEESSRIQDTG